MVSRRTHPVLTVEEVSLRGVRRGRALEIGGRFLPRCQDVLGFRARVVGGTDVELKPFVGRRGQDALIVAGVPGVEIATHRACVGGARVGFSSAGTSSTAGSAGGTAGARGRGGAGRRAPPVPVVVVAPRSRRFRRGRRCPWSWWFRRSWFRRCRWWCRRRTAAGRGRGSAGRGSAARRRRGSPVVVPPVVVRRSWFRPSADARARGRAAGAARCRVSVAGPGGSRAARLRGGVGTSDRCDVQRQERDSPGSARPADSRSSADDTKGPRALWFHFFTCW